MNLLGLVDDLRPLYSEARVFVAPIRVAAGVPIKVLEVSAMVLPVVGTKLMACQLGWKNGVEIGAANDPERMAERAVHLYSFREKWEFVRKSALDRVSREHSKSAFRAELRALLEGTSSTRNCWNG